MVETLGSRRSTGRKRSLRSPSPVPSPRSPRSPSLPASSLPSSPLPHNTASPSLTNHQHKDRSLAEEETNNNKSLPVAKEMKQQKPEPSIEWGSHSTTDSMETEQGRKVKLSSAKSLGNSTTDHQNATLNNVHQRKRERTPSPTPVAPGAKRRAKSPTPSHLVNSTTNDTTGQPSVPKPAHPSAKLAVGGANSSLKLPGAVRLVKPEMSSASKVLTEEIQKQQGQENARLRTLIFKEVKKQGKSEHTM